MSSKTKTQLVVIGAGPGGYVAAFRAADLGMEVTLIDQRDTPGGVCLHCGCIPSKALLHSAKLIQDAQEAKDIGITFSDPNIDINKLREWKNSVVKKLTGGLGQLAKQRKVTFIQGQASFADDHSLEVKKADGESLTLSFEHAIIATGSVPIRLPFAPDSALILDSTTALELNDIPQKLLVVGGGYIGLELGSVYQSLGSQVSVVEMTPSLLPGADPDLVRILNVRIKKRFDQILLGTKVTGLKEENNAVTVSFEDSKGAQTTQSFDKVLISIGRRPDTTGLGLGKCGVELGEKGFIQVAPDRKTNLPHIYAIGDIAGDPMLAHKASHEAAVAVDAILGKKAAFEPKAIPAVVFTDPEIAWCGITETEAKEQGLDVKIEKFPWAASGRAITLNRTDGVTKIIADAKTQRVLGLAMVGPGAGDMISEGVLAIEMGATAEDLSLTIHPHPTLSETIMEAAEACFGNCTHIYKKK